MHGQIYMMVSWKKELFVFNRTPLLNANVNIPYDVCHDRE